jgi:hypothetical protein
VFCIFLFLCAASLFGTIIAQVNEIVADLTTKKKDLDKILEAYLVLNPRSISIFPENAENSHEFEHFTPTHLDYLKAMLFSQTRYANHFSS